MENVINVLGLIKFVIEDMVMPRSDPVFFLPRFSSPEVGT
jgi:hypothetical protein